MLCAINAFLNCLPELSHKTFVVRNCYNFEKIKQKSAEEAIVFDEKYVNIVSVARLSKEKGINRGIIAVSEAIKQSVNVKYHIVGDGIERQGLKELCKDLSIEENVVFYGNQTNPYKYMSKAHLFVLSSIYEGFPIVLAETSSLRIPFVGSQKSIPREFFESQEIWNECVFESQEIEPDFSVTMHYEEYKLAELLLKGVNDEDFRERILKDTSKWEANNDVQKQFEMYDAI